MIKPTQLIMIGLMSVLLILGCSSSSNTVRYKQKGEKQTTSEPTVRFTSNDSTAYTVSDSSLTEEMSDDSEELPVETQSIDISSIMQKVQSNKGSKNVPGESSIKEKMLMEIIKFLDTPYLYGGNTKNGIDCSAFTQAIFHNTFSVNLLRSARDQYTQGTIIDNKEELQFGDLIFFNTRRRVKPGHVGIYIGDNLFAHSSSKNGVVVSSLGMDYYTRCFMGGRRMEGLLNGKM